MTAEILVTVPKSATREQVTQACHQAAFAHFGKYGDGDICLIGLSPGSEDGINKTLILSAELRPAKKD